MTAATTVETSVEEPRLVRTAEGGRLHLPSCPHVRGADVQEASAVEQAETPICLLSRAELDGHGRRRFKSLEDAMRFFGTHAGDERTVRDEVRHLLFDEIWVPNSGTYIAFGLGGLAVAWVHKGYIEFRDGRMVTLASYAPGGGGGAARESRYGDLCRTGVHQMPLTGICDFCD
jgi:hypothetical protein